MPLCSFYLQVGAHISNDICLEDRKHALVYACTKPAAEQSVCSLHAARACLCPVLTCMRSVLLLTLPRPLITTVPCLNSRAAHAKLTRRRACARTRPAHTCMSNMRLTRPCATRSCAAAARWEACAPISISLGGWPKSVRSSISRSSNSSNSTGCGQLEST